MLATIELRQAASHRPDGRGGDALGSVSRRASISAQSLTSGARPRRKPDLQVGVAAGCAAPQDVREERQEAELLRRQRLHAQRLVGRVPRAVLYEGLLVGQLPHLHRHSWLRAGSWHGSTAWNHVISGWATFVVREQSEALSNECKEARMRSPRHCTINQNYNATAMYAHVHVQLANQLLRPQKHTAPG